MIIIGEAASWPPQHGHMQVLQRQENVFSVTIYIRYRRVSSHPQAAVDARTQVLGKLSVYLFVYFILTFIGMHVDGCVLSVCQSEAHQKARNSD